MYKIVRPPAHLDTFGMPSKRDLEQLHAGSAVKVMFADEYGNHVERMWCTIIEISNDGWIKATLDNEPFDSAILNLHLGDSVQFHITDIIYVY